MAGTMRLLMVVPSETSTGEAVTALEAGGQVLSRGGQVRVLASAKAARLFEGSGAEVVVLGGDLEANRASWRGALAQGPDAVLFADYPLLHFANGTPPLADERWQRSLEDAPADLWTFDHLGYAQAASTVFFGPPHLSSHRERLPAVPEPMRLLRPCPLGEPGPVAGRRGRAVRCGTAAEPEPEARQAVRGRHLGEEGGLLIVHAVSGWAETFAEKWGLPHYEMLDEVLAAYLADLPEAVTVVSVNRGRLLRETRRGSLRVVNEGAMDPRRYATLLASADLLVSDNAISSSLGRAVCAGVPAVVLRNSWTLREALARATPELRRILLAMERRRLAAVFPWEVFPIWGPADVDKLGIFHANSVTTAIEWVELFGGPATRDRLVELLLDEDVRAAVRRRQRGYRDRVAALPDAATAMGAP